MKTALLFSLTLGLILVDARAGEIVYNNDYQGVKPGKSTLEDVKAVLGEPKEVITTINGHNYRYEKVM